MKASRVVVVGGLLGIALGAGVSWARFGTSPPLHPLAPPAPPGGLDQGARAKVQVLDRTFNFGPVERDREVRHVFHFTNVGHSTLTLKAGGTTCTKCTIAELSKTELAPGETADVTVAYSPTHSMPNFRQQAVVLTNDPEQRRVTLLIFGAVTANYDVRPQVLTFSKVSTNETTKAEVKIHAFTSDEVEVVGHELTGAESAPYFEVTSEAIPRDRLDDPLAKSGCRVEVTIKPGLPLGPIRQTIRLELRLAGVAENPTVELPVVGTVDSDISIVGRGWNSDAGTLKFDSVKSAEGATRELLVLVRGDRRHDVTIKPGKLDPPWLKVTLGEPVESKSGAVTQVPLKIEIPRGMSPVNRLGSEQGKYGEIVLETTHPDTKQIRMYLQFVITP